MKRIFLFLLCLFASGAFAELLPLSGSSPQTALIQDVLPNPVRLLVTDGGVPVEGAWVRFQTGPGPSMSYGALGSIDYTECSGSGIDMAMVCSAVTGPDGIAQFVTLTSTFAKTFDIVAMATDSTFKRDLGTTTLSFTFVPRSEAMQVTVVAGSGQRVLMGTQAPQPLRFRVQNHDGSPAANQYVYFGNKSSGLDFLGFDNTVANAVTDASGEATSPPVFAGWAVGPHQLYARVFDGHSGAFVNGTAVITVVNENGKQDVALTNMWWGGSIENGWGMSVVKHGPQLFNVVFVYDTEGKPTWLVQPGGIWSEGVGSTFVGSLYSPRSSPWFAYDATQLAPGKSLGQMGVQFFGPTRARLNTRLGNSFILKNLERQDFTGETASPLEGVADMWWGGESQNGWGIAVLEQFGNLFLVWFTYGDDGKPTWFVMPGGTWSDMRSYSGSIYKTVGTDWIVGPYDASKLKASTVGNYTITFKPDGRASFGYVLEGRSGTLALERQSFD